MDQGRRAKVSCNPNTSNPYNKSRDETHAVAMVCGAGMFHAQRRATQLHHKDTRTHTHPTPYTLTKYHQSEQGWSLDPWLLGPAAGCGCRCNPAAWP